MSGIGLNRSPDGVPVTCIFVPSRILHFFLSGAGMVTWPFRVTIVVSGLLDFKSRGSHEVSEDELQFLARYKLYQDLFLRESSPNSLHQPPQVSIIVNDSTLVNAYVLPIVFAGKPLIMVHEP